MKNSLILMLIEPTNYTYLWDGNGAQDTYFYKKMQTTYFKFRPNWQTFCITLVIISICLMTSTILSCFNRQISIKRESAFNFNITQ